MRATHGLPGYPSGKQWPCCSSAQLSSSVCLHYGTMRISLMKEYGRCRPSLVSGLCYSLVVDRDLVLFIYTTYRAQYTEPTPLSPLHWFALNSTPSSMSLSFLCLRFVRFISHGFETALVTWWRHCISSHPPSTTKSSPESTKQTPRIPSNNP